MIQMPTTQLTPVGVGWGNYVIAWLLSYQGSDCRLWQYVYERCMESELCREALALLQSRGFNIRLHKCYDPDVEIAEANRTPQPPNSASKSTTTQAHKPTSTPNNNPKTTQTLKAKPLNHPCRLDAYALLSLKTTPPFSLSSTPPT